MTFPHRRPLKPVLPPDRVEPVRHLKPLDLLIRSRKAQEADDTPHGTPEMDRKPVISPTIGKASPAKPSKTLFRKA